MERTLQRVQVVALCVAASVACVVAASVPVAAATVSPGVHADQRYAIPFAQTNGDILAITKVAGATRDLIAFGGTSRPSSHPTA